MLRLLFNQFQGINYEEITSAEFSDALEAHTHDWDEESLKLMRQFMAGRAKVSFEQFLVFGVQHPNVRTLQLFTEEVDDAEIIWNLFDNIDADPKDGRISSAELEVALKRDKDVWSEEFVMAFGERATKGEDLTFRKFQELAEQIPRVRGQRVQWAKSLFLHCEFAKHLPHGNLFDQMKGIRAMSDEELKAACDNFSLEVFDIAKKARDDLVRGADQVKGKSKAELTNSKFQATAGAYEGKFATLEDFYRGPEGLIGQPNPNLFDGMYREHCMRPSANKFFVTSNYKIHTCSKWEWHWLFADTNETSFHEESDAFEVQESMTVPEDLKTRLLRNKYPGEVGDILKECELLLTVSKAALESDLKKSLKDVEAERELTKLLGSVLDRCILENEQILSGVRPLEAKVQNDMVSIRVAIPCSKVNFEAQRKVCEELHSNGISISVGTEYTLSYCDPAQQQSEKQGRKRQGPNSKFMKIAEEITSQHASKITSKHASKTISQHESDSLALVVAEIVGLRLYTGPMYLIFNAVLRGFPTDLCDLLKNSLDEINKFETTIFVICSGITKLSRCTTVPANRLVYRGLGGMLLPAEFWKETGQGFFGGVEFGLMSTTTNMDIAIEYSGTTKQRGTIFEICAGRIDIGASVGFVSQYPGEEEYLMPPLACMEVIGKPRVKMSSDGEVIIFPLRVNVNLKLITVEELLARRKNLHRAMSKNLSEEFDQEAASKEEELKQKVSDVRSDLDRIKRQLADISVTHHETRFKEYNKDDVFKRLTDEAIVAKMHAVKKLELYCKVRSEGNNENLIQRILNTELNAFGGKGIERRLRSGVEDFPWDEVTDSLKTSINLGTWAPQELQPSQLTSIKDAIAELEKLVGVTCNGKAIALRYNDAKDSIDLRQQPDVLKNFDQTAFVLSANTRLTSLDLSCRITPKVNGPKRCSKDSDENHARNSRQEHVF